MDYEPKVDPAAVLEGYLQTDPKIKGEVVGYLYGDSIKNYDCNTEDKSK